MAIEQLITAHLELWTAATKPKSAAGRGSSRKVEPYGIRRLRELILELAVRGLLVPQDPNDEPATELLKRIAAEKAKLVKKDKLLPPISDHELQALPDGWCFARLGSFTDIVRGITFPASEKNSEPRAGLVACLRTANVQTEIDWEDLLYIDSSFIRRDDQYLQVGDIVMSMANSRDLVGKVSYAGSIPVERATFGGFLGVIRPYQLSASYLMCVLRAPQARASLTDSASQTTNIANVSLEKLNPLVVAVPPLAEQHRIVAKVDELMALCDQLEQQTDTSLSAHQTLVETLLNALTSAADHAHVASSWHRIAEHFDTLFTTEESIDQLKQAILQLAVTGKLVSQDPNDEPATELLQKIAAEKARLVEEGQMKEGRELPPVRSGQAPFQLPKGWAWARFPELGEFARGKSKHRPRNDPKLFVPGIYPLVQTGEVARADEVINEHHSMYSSMGLSQSRLWPVGTLCITIAANIADAALLGMEACFPDSVVGFVPVAPLRDAKYFLAFMRTAREELLRFAPATAQKNINLEILESVLIPVPPQAEMTRISSKLDEMSALCKQLKSHLREAQTTQLHLADALVEKALAGA